MTEKFKGFIDEVRITKGQAMYSKSTKLNNIKLRLRILWGAIKNVFTGKGIWLLGNVQANLGDNPAMTTEFWIKKDCSEESDWEHWGMTFDGKKAIGYVNGKEV